MDNALPLTPMALERFEDEASMGRTNGPVLFVTSTPNRFTSVCPESDFVATDLEAIAAAASRRTPYRAVVAGVMGPDGRESGYRLVHLLRADLRIRCPIYLIAQCTTPSARAYALQCGATKLLSDDSELVGELMQLIGGVDHCTEDA